MKTSDLSAPEVLWASGVRIVTTATIAATMFAATPIRNPVLRIGARLLQLAAADGLGTAVTETFIDNTIPYMRKHYRS